MALDIDKVRTYVEDLLKEKKALTEKDVKAAISKAFKVPAKEVGAGVIRDVRKKMGIDRPTALGFAKAMLAKDPLLEGKVVVDTIGEKFGIRLGPPDVSRLRPKSAKAARPRGRGARKARRGRPAAAAAKGGRPARTRRRRGGRKARPAAAAVVAAKGPAVRRRPARGGAIALTFEGSGRPQDLAAFFLSLGRES